MRARDIILFGILVAVGVLRFQGERAWGARHLAALRARERSLGCDVRRLQQRRRGLRGEGRALSSDPYYVERTLREQYGWGPPRRPAGVPALAEPGGELARVVPGFGPTGPRATRPPQPVQPSRPEPPRPQVDADRALLERLGYTSVAHFQRKMMGGSGSGALDGATRARARRMMALLQGVGYTSVRAFQRGRGLTADGIYGRRTERAILGELRRARSVVVETGRDGGRDGG